MTIEAMLASALSAQELAELRRLDTAGRELRVGAEVTAALTIQDAEWVDGTFIQVWVLALQEGERVTVDLLSDDFDAFLIIGGPGFTEVLVDDDGAGACDARIQLVAEQSGSFRVAANTVRQGGVGSYRIRVTEQPGPTTEGDCTAAPAFTAEQVAWLRSLPMEGRLVSVGTEASGSLISADSVSWDGTFMQAWTLRLPQGGPVYVDMISEDFDSFLILLPGEGVEPVFDDDGAGACNARVMMEELPPGDYTIVANSVLAESTGRFLLRAGQEPLPQVEGPCNTGVDTWLKALATDGRQLMMDREHSGTLTARDSVGADGTYAQAWDLVLRDAPSVTVDLLSDDFDAFLFVLTPTGELLRDDDGGGRCNARVTVTAAADGTYRIVVNTALPDESGSYRLRVTERPGPMTEGECENRGSEQARGPSP